MRLTANTKKRFDFHEKSKIETQKEVANLSNYLQSALPLDREIVFVCIGTDRSTGDSLAPLAGLFLKQAGIENVWGDIYDPVHAANLSAKLEEIKETYDNPFVIGIDACLGSLGSIGTVVVEHQPLKPGTGVGKDLPEVGEMNIAGIVNIGGFMEFQVLQNTRLSLVWSLSRAISDAIILALLSSEVASSF